MRTELIIKKEVKPRCEKRTAIVASTGLRSVGLIAIDHLIKKWNTSLFAELVSPYFSVIYRGPSYFAPEGIPGVYHKGGLIENPAVKFYIDEEKNVILVRGHQASSSDKGGFRGQYEVAEKVYELFESLNVEKIIVLASHGGGDADIYYAGNKNMLGDMDMNPRETGSFSGFSGLILGLSYTRNMDCLSLFARTDADVANLEIPDYKAAVTLVRYLSKTLGIPIDVSELIPREEKLPYYV